jgi:3-isopropylmalate dehydrogenase
MSKLSFLLLPGDGVGPEVMAQARRVLERIASYGGHELDISEDLVGGAAVDRSGAPLADETLAKAREIGCVLLGAVGGPQYAHLPYKQRPEEGLLRLRGELELFANLRPVRTIPALVSASTLKPEFVDGLDLIFVRELTGGVYFGEPRGVTGEGEARRGVNTHVYTAAEIRRAAAVAFELARKRRNKVCSADKANVMEAGLLWREEVTALHTRDYADVELTHMLADNCAMQLVRAPKQFDVILTDNLFGDILSDQASMLTGSLGMLPSAALGAKDASGRRLAMYEPIHGSAPDIAGQNVVNPSAAILSAAMALRESFGLEREAKLIEDAIERIIAAGVRTRDIAEGGGAHVSTTAFTEALLEALPR